MSRAGYCEDAAGQMKRFPLYDFSLFCALIGVVCLAGCSTTGDSIGQRSLARLAADSAECARKASLAAEISINALNNAVASREQAEKNLLDTIKGGEPGRIVAASEKLDKIEAETIAARRQVVQVAMASARCGSAAAALAENVKSAAAAPVEKAARIRHEVEKKYKEASESGAEAVKICEILKTRWLTGAPPAIHEATTPAGAASATPARTSK